jgi:hypothetical protein
MIEKPLRIDQVVLLKSEEQSRRLGRALWAAVEEASQFFTPVSPDGWLDVPVISSSASTARLKPEFRKWYLATEIPDDLPHDSSWTYERLEKPELERLWDGSQRRRGTYDHQTLGVAVSSRLESEAAVVVVDQEIVPPSELRYVIWSGYPGGAVISIAPIDPQYWGQAPDEDPTGQVNNVKRGARAATMSVTGSLLGLSRCDNSECFMFAAVDSVTRLDEMTTLGPEHQVEGLARMRFPSRQDDPGVPWIPQPPPGVSP